MFGTLSYTNFKLEQWFPTFSYLRSEDSRRLHLTKKGYVTAYSRYGRICHIFHPVANRPVVRLLGPD